MNIVPPRKPPLLARPEFLIILVLLAVGMGIYAQTLRFGFITFDDPGYVYENPHVSGGLSWEGAQWAFTAFERSNWHPLTWLSLMADAQLYALNAGGYHLTNLLLHLATAILLFQWLRLATGAVWPSGWVALLFVVHPMHVESVAWVTERKDVLSALFFCLSLLTYTRYTRAPQPRARLFYVLAIGSYALGLTAKPMLVTLPFLLLLVDIWPLRRLGLGGKPDDPQAAPWNGRLAARLVLEKAPFFLLAAASSWVTFVAQRSGAAVVPLEALPVGRRAASALLGFGAYLSKTFVPVNLGIYYPFWHGQAIASMAGWGACLLTLTAAVVLLRRRMPWLLTGWGWFLGMLVPVIGIVQVGGQAVADRYTYLPHIGLFIMICWTADAAWRRFPAARAPILLTMLLSSSALVALSVRQAGYWRSSAALFEHTIQVTDPTSRLYHLLGDALVDTDEIAAAETAYRAALRLQPGNPELTLQVAIIDLRQRRWAEAATLLGTLAQRPDADARVLNDEAYALANLGRDEEAEAAYRKALQRDPSYAYAHYGFANLLRKRGDAPGAALEYENALAAHADWPQALTKLAWMGAHSGDPQLEATALAMAQRAVDLTGGQDLESLDALAAAEASLGRWDRAVTVANSALNQAGKAGTPPNATSLCRERLEMYRARQLPAY